MKTIYLLQSGFVTENDSLLVKSEKHSESLLSSIVSKNKNDSRKNSHLYYSEDVDKLYVKYNNDTSLEKNFDFREKVLLLFKNLISSDKFVRWIFLQNEYANLTSLHVKFIYESMIDLINFANINDTNLERSLSISQWNRLIYNKSSNDDDDYKIDVSIFVNANHKTDSTLSPIPNNISSLLAMWLCTELPIGKILLFLKVIFGNKEDLM